MQVRADAGQRVHHRHAERTQVLGVADPVTRLEQPAGRPSLPERAVSRALRLPVLSNLRFSVSLLEFAQIAVAER